MDYPDREKALLGAFCYMDIVQEAEMKKWVPLLRIDGNQVVNIPEELKLDTDDVVVYRRGDALVIEPRKERAPDDSAGASDV